MPPCFMESGCKKLEGGTRYKVLENVMAVWEKLAANSRKQIAVVRTSCEASVDLRNSAVRLFL